MIIQKSIWLNYRAKDHTRALLPHTSSNIRWSPFNILHIPLTETSKNVGSPLRPNFTTHLPWTNILLI